MKEYQILVINPGSTSTKVALFKGETALFRRTVDHDAAALGRFTSVSEQKSFRTAAIRSALQEEHIDTARLDAVVGRGGGLLPVEGGTYEITPLLLSHAEAGQNGVQHPAQLGPQIAKELADEIGVPAFVVNPPDVDELQDLARMTGVKGVYRSVHLHALNLKETAIRHAEFIGRAYSDCNFIVCHIGGGISVSAHRKGRMIDGYDIVGGEGAMAPTRCGALSVSALLRYIQKNGVESVEELCTKTGGFVSHLGTSDARVVQQRAEAGDVEACMVWHSMIYQICKCVGAMAAALAGKIDAILLGGGMVYSDDLVREISEMCQWIAPVTAYPGEFEMEAMAQGAIRVLNGQETLHAYTGKPVWDGFAFDK